MLWTICRRLDSSLVVMKNCLHRSQLQLARVQWLHEDLFVTAGRQLSQMVMPNRATVMSEMRKVNNRGFLMFNNIDFFSKVVKLKMTVLKEVE